MKKFLLTVMAALLASAAFAAGPVSDALSQADSEIAAAGEQFPKGTWIDPNWDAAWEFGVNNTIVLKDAKTGEVIYNFAKSKRSNFKVNVTNDGLVITFRCDETQRTYKFTKSVTLSTDIKMEIDADFLNEHYTVNMKMRK
ncbi:MAG: hypothetical protein K6E69_04595 [Treponema sp.]|uniref:hypothetical protein n=1 Tax=Treponema sp. TaxID=166 RepID=UPI00298DEE54|nr:hypothetical protein [Treponema sp.]MCR5386379.1 hypothetical protein [Treponema sp.]